jgi:hypothetical protein
MEISIKKIDSRVSAADTSIVLAALKRVPKTALLVPCG